MGKDAVPPRWLYDGILIGGHVLMLLAMLMVMLRRRDLEKEGIVVETTLDVIDRFNEAFNSHDVEAVMALMTTDAVFESTGPAPDGRRAQGREEVSAAWSELFSSAPDALFTAEEAFAIEDRAVVRWRYDWGTGHVRGVDVLRVREGKVAEKLSYVKG